MYTETYITSEVCKMPIESGENTEQFMHLVLANQREILVFILYLVPIKMDADDILQDTLTEMWKKFDQFRPGSDFVAWGVTIARYKVMNYRKKRAKSKMVFSDDIYSILEVDSQKKSNLLQNSIDALESCVHKLSSNERVLLRLRYEKDQTLKTISSRLGKSSQAIHRALGRIHTRLVKCIRITMTVE